MTHFRNIELTKEDVEKFKLIYLREYGEELSYQEAEKEAIRFLQFMSLIM